jgi:hypothetical protein
MRDGERRRSSPVLATCVIRTSVVDYTYRGELGGLSVGKGCIRYPKPDKVEFGVITKLLRATRDSPEQAC